MTDPSIFHSVFHWTQAVWCKAQDIGVAAACRQDQGTQEVCHYLLAHKDIPGVFDWLSNCPTDAIGPVHLNNVDRVDT